MDPCDALTLNIEALTGTEIKPGQGMRKRTLDKGETKIEIVELSGLFAGEENRGCYGELDDNFNLRCKGQCTGGKVCVKQYEECPDGSTVEWCECIMPA